MSNSWDLLDIHHRSAESSGRQGVIGLLIRRPDGRVFVQRRSPTRKIFPGCWDLVGGHFEPGESPQQALERELFEETGWKLGKILGLRQVVDWQSGQGDAIELKREFVMAITVDGNLDAPQLEATKVTEARWIGLGDLDVLNENRKGTDTYVYDCVRCELTDTWSEFRY